MELAQVQIENHGPVSEHNMPCAVCGKNPAVLDMNEGVFEPCWSCKREGWKLQKTDARSFFRKLFGLP